ncbi:MAG TPA: hypothetical protein VEI97_02990, partial [bacterium]|nr:hypothetical protein [bacterium]
MRARPRPLLVLGTALIALSAWGCSPPTTNTKTAGKTTDKAGPPPEPESVFEAHAQGVVYVANAGDDTLTVLDRATLDVVGDPVKAGHQPGSVAVSTTTGRVFFPARFYPEEEIRKTTAKDAIVDNFRSMSYWGIDPAMGNRIVQKAFIGDPEKEGDAVFLALHPQGTWAMIS